MEPEQTEPGSGKPLKVLLVADEEFCGSDLLAELRSHLEGRSSEVELFVIAPAQAGSGLEQEFASFDGPIRDASERLDTILKELRASGITAIGEVGDGDPVVAIGDGLREFDAEEIVSIAHQAGDRAYAEKDLWSKIEN
jgi:hypothetical protein